MPPQSIPVPVVPALQHIGKFQASKMIVKESWNALMKDREILWLPVLSFITTLGAFAVFAIAYFIFADKGAIMSALQSADGSQASSSVSAGIYLTIFFFYLVTYFIQHFFQVSLYTIAYGRFNGQDLTLHDGLKGAMGNFKGILTWSLIMATVGVLLNFIKNKGKAGVIISAMLGATWSVFTYFSLISLTIGKTTIKGSFTESVSLIKKTWGEALIVNFGAGFVFGAIAAVVSVILMIIAVLLPSTAMWIILGSVWLIVMVVMSIVSTTLESIFKLSLYEYAKTGKVPEGFSPELVQNAFKK